MIVSCGIDQSYTSTGLVVLCQEGDEVRELLSKRLEAPGTAFGCHLERAEALGEQIADELATVGCILTKRCPECLGSGETAPNEDYGYQVSTCDFCCGEKKITHGIDWVGIEGFSYGSRGAQEVLGILYACICQAVRGSAYGRLPRTVAPSAVKLFCTGKGNAAKDVMLREVYRKWGLLTNDNNIADGHAIARIGLAVEGRKANPEYRLLAYEERALADLLGTAAPKKTARKASVKCQKVAA